MDTKVEGVKTMYSRAKHYQWQGRGISDSASQLSGW